MSGRRLSFVVGLDDMFEESVVDGAPHAGQIGRLLRPSQRRPVGTGNRTGLVSPHSRWRCGVCPNKTREQGKLMASAAA